MIAKIKLWGNEYVLSSVGWVEAEMCHVSFNDENGKHHVIFKKYSNDELDAETNRNSTEPIMADLEKIVFWTKK